MTISKKTLDSLLRDLQESAGNEDPLRHLIRSASGFCDWARRGGKGRPDHTAFAERLWREAHKHPLEDLLGPLYLRQRELAGQPWQGRIPPQSITDMVAGYRMAARPWDNRADEIAYLVYPDPAGGGAGVMSIFRHLARRTTAAQRRRVQVVAADPDPDLAVMTAGQAALHRLLCMPELGVSVFLGKPEQTPGDWKTVYAAPCLREIELLREAGMLRAPQPAPPRPSVPEAQLSLSL